MASVIERALERGEFLVTCEVIPGRGAFEANVDAALEISCELYATGRIHAVSVTDLPGGNPALLADAFAAELKRRGVPALVHFTCKDRTRNQIIAQLYALQRQGLNDVLFMSGDCQASGWEGTSRAVFDLDSVQIQLLARQMNEGLPVASRGKVVHEKPTHIFAGGVVNPYKYRMGEIVPQYLKAEKKIAAGARYLICQLGYDSRKLEELLLYLRERGHKIPVIANVFILTRGVARLIRSGTIAGCFVSDELMAVLEEEAAAHDKGKAARVERAAQMVAIASGLGCAGVHIGGFGLDAQTLVQVLDRANELAPQWRELAARISFGKAGGDYLYKPAFENSVVAGCDGDSLRDPSTSGVLRTPFAQDDEEVENAGVRPAQDDEEAENAGVRPAQDDEKTEGAAAPDATNPQCFPCTRHSERAKRVEESHAGPDATNPQCSPCTRHSERAKRVEESHAGPDATNPQCFPLAGGVAVSDAINPQCSPYQGELSRECATEGVTVSSTPPEYPLPILNSLERANTVENAGGRKLFSRFGLSRFFHYWLLTLGKRGARLLERRMAAKERKHGGPDFPHGLEHAGKAALYGCIDCGDCGLEACNYSCPMAACPKGQRNGPCGGSMDGYCEEAPGKRFCIWYLAYHRALKGGDLAHLGAFITPPNDWALRHTSAWSNYTHRRDNIAKRIPLGELQPLAEPDGGDAGHGA